MLPFKTDVEIVVDTCFALAALLMLMMLILTFFGLTEKDLPRLGRQAVHYLRELVHMGGDDDDQNHGPTPC
jgi:hypothetical protein